jgi:hypothetical protein
VRGDYLGRDAKDLAPLARESYQLEGIFSPGAELLRLGHESRSEYSVSVDPYIAEALVVVHHNNIVIIVAVVLMY